MKKQCTKCKQMVDIFLFSKDKYKPSGYRSACKTCSSKEFAKYVETDNYKKRLVKYKKQRQEQKVAKPIETWAHHAFHAAKKRAKMYSLEFSITKEWIVNNAVLACPLLGVQLDYQATKSHDTCASLDRKNSFLGYTPDNCAVVSFKANRIKNNATLEEMERIVQAMRSY